MDDDTDEPQNALPDGPEDEGRFFRTTLDGEWIAMPATIAGIRASLPEDERGAFTKAIENTPARDMHLTMYRWARKPTGIEDEDRRTAEWVKGIHEEAEALVILGEDRDVVLDHLQSRLREGP